MLKFFQALDSPRTPLKGELFHIDGNFPGSAGLSLMDQKSLIIVENGFRIPHSIQLAAAHVAFLIATEKCQLEDMLVRTLQDVIKFGPDGLFFGRTCTGCVDPLLTAAALISTRNTERWDPPIYRLPHRYFENKK